MDENKPVENQVTEQPVVNQKPASGNKNLLLAVMVLIVGAAIIGAIFLIAFPGEKQTDTDTGQTQTKTVTEITKTSDLDTADKELDSAELDNYQNDLNQIDSSAKDF